MIEIAAPEEIDWLRREWQLLNEEIKRLKARIEQLEAEARDQRSEGEALEDA